MKSRVWMVSAVALVAASGAALGFAQPAGQEPQNRGVTPTLETYVVSGAPVESSRREPVDVVEDAPVDIPQDTSMDWSPDPNQDEVAAEAYRPAPQRPRKALRNVEGLETDDGPYT
ncbi:MAG: hypothetical protein ACK5P3_14270, partial [Dolichospermum sp.]